MQNFRKAFRLIHTLKPPVWQKMKLSSSMSQNISVNGIECHSKKKVALWRMEMLPCIQDASLSLAVFRHDFTAEWSKLIGKILCPVSDMASIQTLTPTTTETNVHWISPSEYDTGRQVSSEGFHYQLQSVDYSIPLTSIFESHSSVGRNCQRRMLQTKLRKSSLINAYSCW